MGLDRPERDSTRDAQLFYRVVRARYERQRSTAITSNIDWEDWGSALGDDVATVTSATVFDGGVEGLGHTI